MCTTSIVIPTGSDTGFLMMRGGGPIVGGGRIMSLLRLGEVDLAAEPTTVVDVTGDGLLLGGSISPGSGGASGSRTGSGDCVGDSCTGGSSSVSDVW